VFEGGVFKRITAHGRVIAVAKNRLSPQLTTVSSTSQRQFVPSHQATRLLSAPFET
jgi:hypothetical protein